MRKLIVCLTLAAFAFIPAVQAGGDKTCNAKSSCCADQAKTASGSACCAKKIAKYDPTVKGASLLVKR